MIKLVVALNIVSMLRIGLGTNYILPAHVALIDMSRPLPSPHTSPSSRQFPRAYSCSVFYKELEISLASGDEGDSPSYTVCRA